MIHLTRPPVPKNTSVTRPAAPRSLSSLIYLSHRSRWGGPKRTATGRIINGRSLFRINDGKLRSTAGTGNTTDDLLKTEVRYKGAGGVRWRKPENTKNKQKMKLKGQAHDTIKASDCTAGIEVEVLVLVLVWKGFYPALCFTFKHSHCRPSAPICRSVHHFYQTNITGSRHLIVVYLIGPISSAAVISDAPNYTLYFSTLTHRSVEWPHCRQCVSAWVTLRSHSGRRLGFYEIHQTYLFMQEMHTHTHKNANRCCRPTEQTWKSSRLKACEFKCVSSESWNLP